MKHNEIESGIAAILEKDEELQRSWLETPHITHVPFMGNREQFFLLIGIYVRPSWENHEEQVADCLKISRLIIRSGLLTDEKGIEIAAWTSGTPKRRRVMRFSLLDTAYSQAMESGAIDIMRNQYAGISCHWPPEPNQSYV